MGEGVARPIFCTRQVEALAKLRRGGEQTERPASKEQRKVRLWTSEFFSKFFHFFVSSEYPIFGSLPGNRGHATDANCEPANYHSREARGDASRGRGPRPCTRLSIIGRLS